MMDQAPRATSYGLVPVEEMAAMSGLEFIRRIFDGSSPQPPIMEQIEPFDCTAEAGFIVMHSRPGLRHYNPIGSVHGGYSGIMLDSVMGLAVQSMLPAGSGYTTLEYKVSLVRGLSKDTGVVRSEGRVINVGRRVATAEGRILDADGRVLSHATTTCLILELPKP